MITRWHWVRHGPTHARVPVGWSDLPADLSDHAALARLSAHLPQDAHLVSSDLIRASATADILTGRTRLPHRPALREMNYGDWDGVPFAEIAKTDPETSRAFWEDPGDAAPPGGESWNQMLARVAAEVSALNARHAGGSIIAVAHFGVILAALQIATGMTPKNVFSFKIDNLSVTEIDYLPAQDSWRVMRVNHTP